MTVAATIFLPSLGKNKRNLRSMNLLHITPGVCSLLFVKLAILISDRVSHKRPSLKSTNTLINYPFRLTAIPKYVQHFMPMVKAKTNNKD